MSSPNKITGANAGGPHRVADRALWAARIASSVVRDHAYTAYQNPRVVLARVRRFLVCASRLVAPDRGRVDHAQTAAWGHALHGTRGGGDHQQCVRVFIFLRINTFGNRASRSPPLDAIRTGYYGCPPAGDLGSSDCLAFVSPNDNRPEHRLPEPVTRPGPILTRGYADSKLPGPPVRQIENLDRRWFSVRHLRRDWVSSVGIPQRTCCAMTHRISNEGSAADVGFGLSVSGAQRLGTADFVRWSA